MMMMTSIDGDDAGGDDESGNGHCGAVDFYSVLGVVGEADRDDYGTEDAGDDDSVMVIATMFTMAMLGYVHYQWSLILSATLSV